MTEKTAPEIFAELKRNQWTVKVYGRSFFIVEGDLLLDEDELIDYAVERKAMQTNSSAEQDVQRQGLAGTIDDSNRIVRWKKGLVLTYAVLRSSFADEDQYKTVVDAMHKATADWEGTAGINFQHLEHLDAGIEPDGEQPLFVVEGYDSNGQLIAAAFFPNDPPSERRIIIDPSYFSPELGYDQVGVLRHELGHVLGFRHEHIRSGAPAICPDERLGGTVDLTEYDPQSVMHYFCGGVGSSDMEITELDRQGARAVYGPPDSEVIYYE